MKIGNEDVKLYLGGSEVTSIYLGTSQVYSGGSEPTPPISWVSYNENQEVPTGDTIYAIRVNTNAVSPTGGESMDFSDGRSILYDMWGNWKYLDANMQSHNLTIDQDGYVSMEFDNGATITWSSVNTNNSAPYYFPFDCELNYQAPDDSGGGDWGD